MKKNNSKKPFFSEDKKDFKPSTRSSASSGGAKFSKSKGSAEGKSAGFGKKDSSFDKKPYDKKSFDKKPFDKKPFDKKPYGNKSDAAPSFREGPKGRFFKEQQGERPERPSYGRGENTAGRERRSFGDKPTGQDAGAPKKWDKSEKSSYSKKSFGDGPDRYKKEGASERKFGSKPSAAAPYGERAKGKGNKKEGFSKSSAYPRDKDSKRTFSEGKSSPSAAPGEKTIYKGRGKDQKPVYGVGTRTTSSDSTGEKRGFGKNRSKFVELSADRPDYNFDSLPQKKIKKEADNLIRLNKYIANSGICGRREADELIEKGLVAVNGEVIKEMGYKVKKTDHVVYQGKKINPEKPVYVLLNKPKDFITTTEDPMERKTVMKLVENACEERIFPVGRLDRNTTGLLLFTNDGELAAKLSHPSNEIKKIYQVTLDKALTNKDEEEIIEGLTLEDGDAKVDDLQVLSKDRNILGLEIHIGRNRIVRRIFAHLGYEVESLDRVMYAGLDKKDLKRGHYRFLTEQEVIRLKYYI